MTQTQWDKLYTDLYAVYDTCGKLACHSTIAETYRHSLGKLLDHMIENKPYLKLK